MHLLGNELPLIVRTELVNRSGGPGPNSSASGLRAISRWLVGALLCAACGGDGSPTASAHELLTVQDCPAGTFVIQGTPGDDTLVGTNGNDCILGHGGNDTIQGRGGNDFLIGGLGNDVLDGGAGDDVLHGEDGEDLLLGRAGRDRLFGGAQSDVLDGDAGIDTGDASAGNDVVLTSVEQANGGPNFDFCVGTNCESSNIRTCRGDLDCAPDARCLFGTACVSCQGEATCVGTLAVDLDVVEDCDEGFELDQHGACVDVDECKDALDDCDAVASCVNDAGTFHCACPSTHWGSGHGSSGCDARAVALAAGRAHTCALLADGRVKCWGDNAKGQLGIGDTEARGDEPGELADALPATALGPEPVTALAAGDAFTCALRSSGIVVCWGDNAAGQLGVGSTNVIGDEAREMGARLVTVDLGAPVERVSAGETHACASLADGTVKCWGKNDAGELGLGDNDARGDEPEEMGMLLPAVDLGASGLGARPFAGRSASCALFENGELRCWGSQEHGLAGLFDGDNRGDEPGEMGDALARLDLGTSSLPLSLHVSDHACALFGGGSLRCWGNNASGELGLGDTEARGDDPGELGMSLPVVDLGAPVTELFSAGSGACARLDTRELKCWGNNASGILGLGDTEHRGDGAGEMGAALPALSVGDGAVVVDVVGGAAHRCALFEGGQVKCWGSGALGQHGLGSTADVGDDPGEMGEALPYVVLGH